MDEQAGRETPKSEALQGLEKNLGNIGRLLGLMTRSVGHIFAPSSEVIDKLMEATVRLRDNPDELRGVQSTLLDALRESALEESAHFLGFMSDWMLVMMVSFSEAYLEDVLILIVGRNPAKKILGSGKPELWIKTLQRLGAKGYGTDLGADMKKLWRRRHNIVHSRVHSRKTQQHITISECQRAFNVINSFLKPTDRFVVKFLKH